jgi:hypothetical protein
MADVVTPVLLGKTVDHIPPTPTLINKFQPPLFSVRSEPAIGDWTQALGFAVEHGWTAYHSFDASWLPNDLYWIKIKSYCITKIN